MKKHNFNAGPSILPREVIEKTAQAVLDFNGSGLSIMEISHRAKDFQPVVDEAVALFKELLNIPEGYSVLFLGGGASLEFCMIPFNFLEKKAAYLNTGVWAKKAMKEAKAFGEVVEVASSAEATYTYIPKDYTVPADADYFHVTTNIDARRVPRAPRRGQETRPPQTWKGNGTLRIFRQRGRRPPSLAAERRSPARPPRAVPAQNPETIRLPAGNHPPYRQQATLCHLRPLCQVRKRLIPAYPHTRGRRGIPAETDELSSPLRDIPRVAAFVPRPAAAPCRIWHSVPLQIGRAHV